MGDAGRGGGASRIAGERCGLLLMPHEKDDRQVGPLRYELSVHGVSLNCHARRHDHYEFVDAEGEDLLCLSRAGDCIELA